MSNTHSQSDKFPANTDESNLPAGEHLVFIETSGNQTYLFATNKLKENIGASQLTKLVGTQWAPEAAKEQNARTIMASSGKAMFVAPSFESGRKIVQNVTEKALREAPGLQVAGAVVSLAQGEAHAISKAHQSFNQNRDALVNFRAAVLPWAEPCATSGLPAASRARVGNAHAWFCAESLAKRAYAEQWWTHMKSLFRSAGMAENSTQLFIETNIDALEQRFEDSQWLGVIFADGNGLGQIFIDLDHHLQTLMSNGVSLGSPLDVTRKFSQELEAATEWAFVDACAHVGNLGGQPATLNRSQEADDRLHVPVIPLILAGDDMTVLVQGEYALPFAHHFLEAFEERTGDQNHCPTIAAITQVALGATRLSAGAGVALVKHHFPFHLAHELAADLMRSAKSAKMAVRTHGTDDQPFPVSSLDFHVLFDSSYTHLDVIREQRLTVDQDRLYGGPYVVTPIEHMNGATPQGKLWAEQHHIDLLLSRVDALQARDAQSNRLRLPSTQMHALREALTLGKSIADKRLGEFVWLDSLGLDALKEPQPNGADQSLYVQRNQHTATRFIDALTSVGFWPRRYNQLQKDEQTALESPQ